MAMVERGRVRDGAIVFPEPLPLPEGAEVIVRVETIDSATDDPAPGEAEFSALPFFGMWADREDLEDSGAYVRQEREKWHSRLARQD